jgi:glutamyl-tRNA reductase
MGMLVVGLNHRTAPVEIRERLAFSRDGAATALMLFRSVHPGCECAIISTCNRVEVIVNGPDGELELDEVVRFLSQVCDVPAEDFVDHLYHCRGQDAVAQIFRVISGLDSMVVGEYQIVNQMKQAYQLAHEQGTTGPVLHRLFHHAFGVSKRVRTETSLGDGKTSIPSVAVEVIARELPDFAGRRILIVGAGEMAQLTAQYLRQAEARRFVVTTRTLKNAASLAEACGGEAAPFSQLDAELERAEIVITATNCPAPILTVERITRCQQARSLKPVLLIDLAVPRNIEADVASVPGVVLHDVDALGRIVAENWRQRQAQAEVSEKIIAEEVEAFDKWIAESRVRPLIEQMFADVRALAEIELRSLFRRCPDLTDKQKDAVEQLADRLVAKLMHPCVSTMRQESMASSAATLAEAFRAVRLSFSDRLEDGAAPARPVGVIASPF